MDSKTASSINHSDAACVWLSVTALVLALGWYYFRYGRGSRRRWARPLPPGPRGLPVVGYLPFVKPDLHRFAANLAQTYGPIFKFWLGNKLCIVVSSPQLAKEILCDHDVIFANRDLPAAAIPISFNLSDIAFSPYGPKWQMMRKVCAREMMTPAVLDSNYGLRRKEVRQVVSDTYKRAGTAIEIGELAFQTSMNVITSMVWGGTVTSEGKRIIGTEFRRVMLQVMLLLASPNVSDLFPAVAWFDLQGVMKRMKKLMLGIERIFDSVVNERRRMDGQEGASHCKDFLQQLLQLKESGDPKAPITENNIKALLMDVVSGATDTTSTTVEWAMAELVKHPEVMKKAQDELDQVVGPENMVEEAHLPKLPYLGAVVKEVLRLHPPVCFLVPRKPSQDCVVGRYTVPEGAQVLVNAWAIHRDPAYWTEPLAFRPARFLGESEELNFNGRDFRYLPFGSGRRICVGVPMAERMVVYILASLLHSFDWELGPETKLELSELFAIILKKKTPLALVPRPRLEDPQLYSSCDD